MESLSRSSRVKKFEFLRQFSKAAIKNMFCIYNFYIKLETNSLTTPGNVLPLHFLPNAKHKPKVIFNSGSLWPDTDSHRGNVRKTAWRWLELHNSNWSLSGTFKRKNLKSKQRKYEKLRNCNFYETNLKMPSEGVAFSRYFHTPKLCEYWRNI